MRAGSHMVAAWKRMDWLTAASMLALIAVGILFIFSASHQDDAQLSELTQRQIVWALAGIVAFFGAVAMDYRNVGRVAWAVYAGCMVLLLLLFVVGKKVHGATSWMSLFGIQLQPSELAKLGTILLLARYLSEPARDIAHLRSLAIALALVGLPFLLILQQPDFGTASTLLPLALAMLFVAGLPLRYIVIVAIIGVLAAVPGWFLLDDYQRERVLVFFDPGRDPRGTGWNSIQSGIAVGSGGLTGKGYMMGTQNILGFLPRTVAPTDFIFSVIAEEMGFVGSAVLLLLFAVLLVGCIRAALASRDKFGRLLAVGVAALLFFHVFVNMAMTVGLVPITGLPLPLVSYGGSFMICTMAGLGLVQSVYARRFRR